MEERREAAVTAAVPGAASGLLQEVHLETGVGLDVWDLLLAAVDVELASGAACQALTVLLVVLLMVLALVSAPVLNKSSPVSCAASQACPR